MKKPPVDLKQRMELGKNGADERIGIPPRAKLDFARDAIRDFPRLLRRLRLAIELGLWARPSRFSIPKISNFPPFSRVKMCPAFQTSNLYKFGVFACAAPI